MKRLARRATASGLRPQLATGVRMLLILTVLTGLAFPLAVTGLAQGLFPRRANGSLIQRDGTVIGSALVGQAFTDAGAFRPRPSAAGAGYDAAASGASNLGPSSPDLLAAVQERAAAYRRDNGLPPAAAVPVDAVTASGSGLDPHISIANARLQAPRVARATGIPLRDVLGLIDRHTQGRTLAVLA